MSTEVTPRWRRLEPDERREQIFSCAIRLFGERPYAAVSTADIARAAGVARGLINHYFGTKRELYLEVVRAMVMIPVGTEAKLPAGSLHQRVEASVTWFLDSVARYGKTWVAAIGAEGVGQDPDVEHILNEADERAADTVLAAVGLAEVTDHREQLRAMIRSYGGMVKAAVREWLTGGTLSRSEVHQLLTHTLYHLVRHTFPAIGGARPPG